MERNKYFSDPDDFLPLHSRDAGQDREAMQNYLLENGYRDGLEPPPDEKLLFYNGIPIGSRGNIIAINGRAKSRKSVIASAIMSSCFIDDVEGFLGFTAHLAEPARVLNFDTEQGLGHWIEGSKRVIKDAGLFKRPEGFFSHHFREKDVDERIAFLEYCLDLYTPDLAVIDGITDLVYDLNSQEEATRIGGRLMQLSTKYNCLIICIIHITKGTGYMTGALGTWIEKKCQTSIKCEKDEKEESITYVQCQYARDKGFPAFGIQYDDTIGRYKRMDDTVVQERGPGARNGPETKSEAVCIQFLDAIFRLHQSYKTDTNFKYGMSGAAESIGIKLNNKDRLAWFNYFKERGLILTDPLYGIMRVPTLNAVKAQAPPLDFTKVEDPDPVDMYYDEQESSEIPPSPLADHSNDDLPF